MGSETILFVGSHYEVANPGVGQAITKYYFAGATRIAMRKYTVPQPMQMEYLLGDHPSTVLRTSLGSTSLTTDKTGEKVSEIHYKPWGETRSTWTKTQTTTPAYTLSKFTFTGQYSYMDDPTTAAEEGFGLMYYGARWYDPALGRMTQADSIIPGAGDSQSWDRFSYVKNSPVRYNDPTGHYEDEGCGTGGSLCIVGTPSHNGIRTVERYMDPTNGRIDVAAGIAVQSRYFSFWDSREFAWAGVESFGIAQVTDRQMKEYGLEGYDQDDPNVAIHAMTERIDRVLSECKNCTAADKLIAAALAQNGSGFPKEEMKDVLNNYMRNGVINWNLYFDDRAKTATDSVLSNIRAAGHQTYDTRYMVFLYTNDLLELEQRGWKLPYGLTTSQIKQIQKDTTCNEEG